MTEEKCLLEQYIESSLAENYASEGVLSEKASGSVELYRHCKSGNKLLLVSSFNRNDDVFRALRDCRSPYLPRVYDVCSTDERLIILLEYVNGTPLSSLCAEKPLAENIARKYILDVCDSLSVLHSLGITHRDIKPSNIIVTEAGRAMLIDFGIARFFNAPSSPDTLNLGTVGYAAPEQYGIFPPGPAADIYALGVLLNEAVLGVHPTVDTPHGSLGRIISRCVTTQASKRYPSVEKLKRALR